MSGHCLRAAMWIMLNIEVARRTIQEKEEKTKPPKRSFGKWVREGLPDNPWLLFSFIVAIPSGGSMCIAGCARQN